MINRRKLYIDYDNTLVNSVKRICDIYNEDYKDHSKFKEAKWYLVEDWNFITQCPLAGRKVVDDYFNRREFFNYELEFMENAYEIVNKLSVEFDIYIVSMGNSENLKYKEEWIESNLPFVKEFIPVNFDSYQDKSHIDMSNGILIEDCASNLETSNADCKILYGDIFDWNKNYKGKRCWNWTEVYNYLLR